MKKRGNVVSNKEFNPKNKQADIPLDADEVDSAMERFIRKKYVEKSLVDGRPAVPSRSEQSPSLTQASQPSPNPDLPAPSKKHKFFGFSLRTSSKKDRTGVENTFKITPVEYSPTTGVTREIPESEMQDKLAQLRDMGFRNQNYVPHLLRDNGGDLERTIARLVKLPADIIGRDATPPPSARPKERAALPPTSSTESNNPWAKLDQPQQSQGSGIGISFESPNTPQQRVPSANPWQSAISNPNTGLEQSMASMQVSNPLFPHHTGGYTAQSYQDPRLQTMTPPTIPQQYASASPSSNPFQQYHTQPLSSQSTGNNPFLQQQQSQPVFAPSMANNPFLNMQQQPSQVSTNITNNPFGLPPSSSNSQSQAQPQQYVQSLQAQAQAQPQSQSSNPFNFAMQGQQSQPQMQHAQTFPLALAQQSSSHAQSSQPQIPNFNYGQVQQNQQSYQSTQQQQQYQQPIQNQYQNQQYQSQPQSQSQLQPQPQAQVQTLQAQPTGRYTKTDIMALFNTPSSFQPQHLAPVQESDDASGLAQQQQLQASQPISPVPSNKPYGAMGIQGQAKRAATMPVTSNAMGSRNPFLAQQQQGQAQQQQQQQFVGGNWQQTQGVRHASNESVSVNNPMLMDGRHSPDAFASLSSRY